MAARSDLLSLIRHAKDDLDDSTRRLVLADWLEEYGDELDRSRGESIRAAVAGPPALGRGLSWAGALVKLRGTVIVGPRGFLSWSVPARTLLTKAALPLVGSEELSWVASLRVTSLTGPGTGRLVDAGLLDEAETIDFRGQPVRTDGAGHLARMRADVALRHLNLEHGHVMHTGVKRLVRAAWLPRLRSLDLYRNMLWGDSLGVLAAAPLDALRRLRVGFLRIDDAAANLVGAAWLPGLQDLDLSDCHLHDGGTTRLVQKGDLAGLRSLSLSNNALGPPFVAALARSERIPALERLDLSNNALGDSLSRLAAWPGLRGVRVLDVRNSLHPSCVVALAQSPQLDAIESFRVEDPQDDDYLPLRERFGDRLTS